jgi:sporulation integral membrane protein YtvI
MDSKYNQRKRFIINILFFGLAAALFYVAVKYVLGWIMPFIIGFLVSLLLRPAIRFLSKKSRIPYKVVAIILVLLFYAVVVVILILIGAKIIIVLQDGFAKLPTIYSDQIEPLLTKLLANIQELTSKLDPSLNELIGSMTSSISNSAGSVVTGISAKVIVFLSNTFLSLPGFLLATLLSIISTVFFAMDFNSITSRAVTFLPEKIQGYVARFRHIASQIVVKYVKSYSILLLVTFFELSIGFVIIGVDNSIAVAALVALIDLLPILGTGAVIIPWLIVKLAQGDMGFALGLAVIYAVVYIVRNILEPRIVGRQIGVHPLAMLISMYVGLQVFGFIGIFVLPILLVVIKGFYDERKAGGQGETIVGKDAGQS